MFIGLSVFQKFEIFQNEKFGEKYRHESVSVGWLFSLKLGRARAARSAEAFEKQTQNLRSCQTEMPGKRVNRSHDRMQRMYSLAVIFLWCYSPPVFGFLSQGLCSPGCLGTLCVN